MAIVGTAFAITLVSKAVRAVINRRRSANVMDPDDTRIIVRRDAFAWFWKSRRTHGNLIFIFLVLLTSWLLGGLLIGIAVVGILYALLRRTDYGKSKSEIERNLRNRANIESPVQSAINSGVSKGRKDRQLVGAKGKGVLASEGVDEGLSELEIKKREFDAQWSGRSRVPLVAVGVAAAIVISIWLVQLLSSI
ncbi:MAG: hypothetical protein HOL45_09875 [Chloroflexi bacterium]|nr:hypothetical protein [Chloroflexota bacterium]